MYLTTGAKSKWPTNATRVLLVRQYLGQATLGEKALCDPEHRPWNQRAPDCSIRLRDCETAT